MTYKILLYFLFLTANCFAIPSLDELTLEEKVGQLLMVHFTGETDNQDAKTLIQKAHVGAFIYYNWSNGLHSPEQIQNLSKSLQKLASQDKSIPLFIAVDQEGGKVARLTKGFTLFPGNWPLGLSKNASLAEEAAFIIGQEVYAVGINLNLAPVVDVNSNPRNPVIGVRAFSDDPEIVSTFGESALKGYQRAHIIPCLKHFPGHGDVETDSHADLPIVNKSKEALLKTELLPFSKLAGTAETIMTAHILVPALDEKYCSTLSRKTLDYLRNDLKFKGIIITDSLVMEGILKQTGTVDEACIQSLNAGCDLLCLGGKQLIGNSVALELHVSDIMRIHENIVKAVREGRVSEEKINESVLRVLDLKNKYLKELPNERIDLSSVINTPEHQAIAKKIEILALNVQAEKNETVQKLGEKIWKNECNGSIDGLTSWNKGEEFASLGIGHFIWYPEGVEKKFTEAFPKLLTFLQSEKVKVPEWLTNTKSNPWKSREDFYENFSSQNMVELRQFLYDTRNLQAQFIVGKLNDAMDQINSTLSPEEKEQVRPVFNQLARGSQGLYALIDYLNFKGLGTSSSETYKGQGWGLKQVLLKLSPESKDLVKDFAQAAKELLQQRVDNSPPERNEQRWLPGWNNRLDTY